MFSVLWQVEGILERSCSGWQHTVLLTAGASIEALRNSQITFHFTVISFGYFVLVMCCLSKESQSTKSKLVEFYQSNCILILYCK